MIISCHLQVSQYTFAMCSYREKKPDPTEMMQLDGFTVDYCEPLPGKLTYLLSTYVLQLFPDMMCSKIIHAVFYLYALYIFYFIVSLQG